MSQSHTSHLYNKTRHSAGQTAGPIGLKIFVDTHGWPGDVSKFFFSKVFLNIFFQHFFFPRATPGPSVSFHIKCQPELCFLCTAVISSTLKKHWDLLESGI